MECICWEFRDGNTIVGNNIGKIGYLGYFVICMLFFGLLDVSEAIFCVLPIVEHVKKKLNQPYWEGEQDASDSML